MAKRKVKRQTKKRASARRGKNSGKASRKPSKAKTPKTAKRPRQGSKSSKSTRNWSRIRSQWYATDLALEPFLRSKKIPFSTGKLHLSVRDKERHLAKSREAADVFRDRLAKMLGKEDARLYVSSLKHVTAAAQEILLDSAARFKESPVEMSQKEAGRLALAAGDQLLRTSDELQGIPEDEDGEGWPLTRNFWPFSYQRDFLFDMPSTIEKETRGKEKPFILAFIGGLGSGKTLVGAQKAGKLAELNRGRLGMVVGPTYPMLRDSTKATFLKACTDKGLTFKHLKTENAIVLFGDTKILFRSMEDPETLRGPNIAWAWIDEGALVSSRDAFDIVSGRIRGEDIPEPCLLFTSTPKYNWTYDVMIEEAVENRVQEYRARTHDNPTLGDYEQRLRDLYDPRFASQELDAEFVDLFSGKAYWNYSSVDNTFEPGELKLKDGLPLDLTCDFNVSPMCWNVSQDIQRNGDSYTYVHDEIHLDTAGTDVTIAEFIERYGETKAANTAGVRVWGDATGQHKGTSATRSDYEIIEQALKAAEIPVDINIGRSNPRQRDRVLAVNARLLAGTGKRRLFISKVCKQTLIDFQRTRFIPGTQQLDKTQTVGKATKGGGQAKATLTHHTDAIGYKIWRMWPLREMTVTQPRRQ